LAQRYLSGLPRLSVRWNMAMMAGSGRWIAGSDW